MSPAPFRPRIALDHALAGRPVRVGTKNAAKCEAVRAALASLVEAREEAAVRVQVLPTEVDSGVAEQPVGFEEIAQGARHRARAAFAEGGCVLAFGIEDGLVELPDGLAQAPAKASTYNVGCAWVFDGERESAGFSSGFAYPAACGVPALRDQAPIGDLFDTLWRSHREDGESGPSGPRGGNIGKLTGGRVDRSAYGEQAVVCALIRFLHEDLYD